MSDQIKETAGRWAEAIKTRNPETVLQLYHPDAILWGTLSPVVRHGHNAIQEYFVTFLQNEGIYCRFIEGITRVIDDFGFYSGVYEFTWRKEGRLLRVPARFSFIYKMESGKWLVLEHHSSLFPELPLEVDKYFIEQA